MELSLVLFSVAIYIVTSHPINDQIADKGGMIQIGGDDFLSRESLELIRPPDKSGSLPALSQLHQLVARISKHSNLNRRPVHVHKRQSSGLDVPFDAVRRPRRHLKIAHRTEYDYYDRWRKKTQPQMLTMHRVKRDGNGAEVAGENYLGLNGQNASEYIYDYDQFFREYITEEEEKKLNESKAEVKTRKLADTIKKGLGLFGFQPTTHLHLVNCTDEDRAKTGLRGIDCIIQDYKLRRTSFWNITKRCLKIVFTWLMIVSVVFTVLWMWQGLCWGWCCCSIFHCCYILEPGSIVKDLKEYLIKNPPGIMANEDGSETAYNPSTKELELYQMLHFKMFAYK